MWGEGRLDAFAAVERSPRGPSGILQGVVTPAQAIIQAVGPITRTIVSDSAGSFSLRLPVGSYSVSASLFGSIEQRVQNVVISEGATTTQNFQLLLAPVHQLTGHVSDNNGQPVANASVRILGTPLLPSQTDVNGLYTFQGVPAGTYSVRADAGGCNGPATKNLVLNRDKTLDFSLPEKTDGAGYTCQLIEPNYIEASTVLATSGDDAYFPIELPFPFVFYDGFYENAYVCINGSLKFTRGCDAQNRRIPGTGSPAPALYAFWDDLILDEGASIRSELFGVQPNRRFVIEWRNVSFFEYYFDTKRVDFEIVLFEIGPSGSC